MKSKILLLTTIFLAGSLANAEADRQCELLAKLTAIRMYSAAEDYGSVGNKLKSLDESLQIISNPQSPSISASDIIVEEESVVELEQPVAGSDINHDIRKVVKVSIYPNSERKILEPFLRITIDGKNYGVDKTSGKLLLGICKVRATTLLW